jgi:hypothetical protein
MITEIHEYLSQKITEKDLIIARLENEISNLNEEIELMKFKVKDAEAYKYLYTQASRRLNQMQNLRENLDKTITELTQLQKLEQNHA